MYGLISLLGIALIELIYLIVLQKRTKIRLLSNYKYLLAEYQVNEIQKYISTLPKDQAYDKIREVIERKSVNEHSNNKLSYNRSSKTKISNESQRYCS